MTCIKCLGRPVSQLCASCKAKAAGREERVELREAIQSLGTLLPQPGTQTAPATTSEAVCVQAFLIGLRKLLMAELQVRVPHVSEQLFQKALAFYNTIRISMPTVPWQHAVGYAASEAIRP